MVALKVFGQPAATDVARVLTTLFEKNLEFQLIREDEFKGQYKLPKFLQLQDPSGQAIFEDGKLTLGDSREICRYICDQYADKGNRALFGTGVLERASIEQWLQAEALSFEHPSSTLVFNLAFAPALGIKPDELLVKESEAKLSRVLDVYERRLGEHEYLTGNEFTLADLSHLPNSHYLVTKTRRGHEIFAKRRNVERWVNAMFARPSWQKVVEMQRERPGPLDTPALPASMGSVKVFGSPTSAEVARVLTCLFEKEVEFQLICVDNYKGGQRLPEYLKLQPFGHALTFEDGNKTLVESREICRYATKKYIKQGNPCLLGSGTLERAAIEQWLITEKQSFDPPSSELVFNLAFAPLIGVEQDEEKIDSSIRELSKVLDIYEKRLQETEYLAGDHFTLADLSHLPNAQRLVSDTTCHPLFTSRKRVYEWWTAISCRPAWKRVVEMQQEPPHPI